MSIFDTFDGKETLEERSLAIKGNPNISYLDVMYHLTHRGESIRETSPAPTAHKCREYIEHCVAKEWYVPTLPLLVQTMMQIPGDHTLKQHAVMSLSEEHYGVNTKGRFISAGEVAVVTIHGIGALSPEVIASATRTGGDSSYLITDTHLFDTLLKGELACGNINLYTPDDLRNDQVPDIYGRYGVVSQFNKDEWRLGKIQSKKQFLESDLVLARLGSVQAVNDFWNHCRGDARTTDRQLYHTMDTLIDPILKVTEYVVSTFLGLAVRRIITESGFGRYWGTKLQ